MTVFQRRNNVSLSMLNQRRNLTLKTKRYMFWSNLSSNSAFHLIFYESFQEIVRVASSIFSKLQVYENIHESLSFSITLKDDFCNNVILQIFSPVESCFMEIRVLLPETLQEKLPQVRFLGISRTITLLRCI